MNSFFDFDKKNVNFPVEFSLDNTHFYNATCSKKFGELETCLKKSVNNDKNINKCLNSFEDFLNIFNKETYNYFDNFDFSNVVIAGGFICGCLTNNISIDSDIDIFLYGLNKNDFNEKICKIIYFFSDKNPNNRIIKTKNTVTIYFNYPNRPIQIILHENKTIEDCVLQFDNDYCKIIYNGTNLYCSEKTFLSISNNYILLNDVIITTSSFDSVKSRLIKYFNRNIKICIDNYNYCDLYIKQYGFFDDLIFNRYHFLKNKAINMMFSQDCETKDSGYEKKVGIHEKSRYYKYGNFFNIRNIESSIRLYDLKYVTFVEKKIETKKFIDILILNKHIVKNSFDQNIVSNINIFFNNNHVKYDNKILMENFIKYFETQEKCLVILINNIDFVKHLFKYFIKQFKNDNITLPKLIGFVAQLYVYHHENIEFISEINKIMEPYINVITCKLNKSYNINQFIFAFYPNNIVSNAIFFLNTNKKILFNSTDVMDISKYRCNIIYNILPFSLKYVEILVNNFKCKDDIIYLLIKTIMSNIKLNLRELYFKILNFLNKYEFDEDILELFFDYYIKIYNDTYIDFHSGNFENVFDKCKDSKCKNIEFFINKKLTIYNFHMINKFNVADMFDKNRHTVLNNKLMYETIQTINKII